MRRSTSISEEKDVPRSPRIPFLALRPAMYTLCLMSRGSSAHQQKDQRLIIIKQIYGMLY
jgi:hypothetical protein